MKNIMIEVGIETISLETNKDVVTRLLENQHVIAIDLQLSPEERKILQNLKIEIEGLAGNFLYWGSVNNADFLSKMRMYLGAIGENDDGTAHVISHLIVRIAKQVTGYFNTECAWIETKTFLANDTFKVPRWHTDNKFFKPSTVYKLVWAVKGSQTRFGITKNPAEFARLTALEIQAGHGTEENIRARKELDQIVSEIKIPITESAIVYQSGGDDPVVHSEPHMDENRLFISIIPGTKEEIREWYERKRQKDIWKGVEDRQWYYNAL